MAASDWEVAHTLRYVAASNFRTSFLFFECVGGLDKRGIPILDDGLKGELATHNHTRIATKRNVPCHRKPAEASVLHSWWDATPSLDADRRYLINWDGVSDIFHHFNSPSLSFFMIA